MALKLPKIIGHRGACGYAPENTLESIKTAADMGCTWVELDVKLTKDDVAIIFHDDELDRTTNGSGLVMNATYEEIKQLEAGSWFAESFAGIKIPTLEETLELLIDLDLGLNLEIKPCAGREIVTAEAALDILSRYWDETDKLLISSSPMSASKPPRKWHRNGTVVSCWMMRGSTGYGKKFLDLDNGTQREDAVKDIGALLDLIKKQPDLDADRVLVQGASYGGYMSLSVAAKYDDRIRGAISDSGATNLATFIERTEGWRRDLRRAEFGDERDPKIKAFMEKTAPLNNIRKIKKPLLIIQGKNDPRVAASEADAMDNAAKRQGTSVWYVLAGDEGHTFVKQDNRNFRLHSIILFAQEHLLRQANNQQSPSSQRPKLEK